MQFTVVQVHVNTFDAKRDHERKTLCAKSSLEFDAHVCKITTYNQAGETYTTGIKDVWMIKLAGEEWRPFLNV